MVGNIQNGDQISRSSSRYNSERNNLTSFGMTSNMANNGLPLSDIASTSGHGTCSSSLALDSPQATADCSSQAAGNCDTLNVKQYEVPFSARGSMLFGSGLEKKTGNSTTANGEKEEAKTLICY